MQNARASVRAAHATVLFRNLLILHLHPPTPIHCYPIMTANVPRSVSPDIELGTYTPHLDPASLQLAKEDSVDSAAAGNNQLLCDPGPSSRLPTYSSYDPVLQPNQPQSPPLPPSSPLPPASLATDSPLGSVHPNIAEGNYGDSSDRLFSVYLSQAEKFDKESSESWKGDTEGILVFTGLFSATVAAFIIESYKQLQPGSSDATVLLLTQISQQLAALSTGNTVSIPSGFPPQVFRPSASAVRVNSLWFLSLALSLTCALLATLMQQWVRRYLQVSQRWYAPYKRARIRTFFAEGVECFGLPRAVEALPALLHASLFLFFAGLVDFLININHTVAFSLLSAVAVGASAYFLCTALPLMYPNSPYQTPLTNPLWMFQQAVLIVVLDSMRRIVKFIYEHTGVVAWKVYGRIIFMLGDHSRRISQGLSRSCEAIALGQSTEMDARALAWTLDALDEDHELEQFLAAIPGYYRSTTVRPPGVALEHLTHHEGLDSPLEARIFDLLCPRGTAPNVPPASAKELKRRVVCLEALYCLPGTVLRHLRLGILEPTLFSSDPLFASTEAWAVATSMVRDTNRDIALAAHCVSAVLVAAWRHGYAAVPGPPWGSVSSLAQHLDVPEGVVQRWIQRGDNMMLASFIHLLESTLDDLQERLPLDLPPALMRAASISPRYQLVYTTLGLVNKFSAAGAPRELQDAFAALWARVDDGEREARESGYRARGLEMILRRMQPVRSRVPVPAHWTPA
ncbi:hypothetical protein B0F90DRAFT_1758947 [Multifurca ochricompacta]|uniref:DUF6535 domain-containing protein n=1 Tax=Multifurca ochricompacta TaxID=376703 RepID=A0AAD4QGY6_9AGAM|nr:hypothetical protein B0F90DRAFT_1758947 [Multifurca ochricompacta]